MDRFAPQPGVPARQHWSGSRRAGANFPISSSLVARRFPIFVAPRSSNWENWLPAPPAGKLITGSSPVAKTRRAGMTSRVRGAEGWRTRPGHRSGRATTPARNLALVVLRGETHSSSGKSVLQRAPAFGQGRRLYSPKPQAEARSPKKQKPKKTKKQKNEEKLCELFQN